ncbi:uncharacterized protein [Phyllobates terribilis]|uniref:uncharacterized protein n=1 Tax=Phyllobates terribilis TaxID=111132 RepID=UPI003CCB1473
MPNSPTNQDESRSPEPRRICDFCSERTALLFCRADAAKLCLACDKEVHSTAQLFTKHTRRLLCDACDTAPAVIVCSTHRSVLCQNCDFEIHNSGVSLASASGSSHDRRPLEGFSGQPSASEIATFLGLEGIDCSKSFGVSDHGLAGEVDRGIGVWGDISDFWNWDELSPRGVVSVDDLVVSGGENHSFQAMVALDTLPKDRNSTCGQYKLEMIHQLCQLAKSETDLHGELQQDFGCQTEGYEQIIAASDVYDGYQHEFMPEDAVTQKATLYVQDSKDEEAINEAFLSDIFLGSNAEEVALVSDRNSDIGNDTSLAINGSQGTTHNVAIPSKTLNSEVSNADRGSALTRYKEKKRSRRYEKHIRYESRKALAETRIRVKGRFAKVNQSTPRLQS